MTRLTKTIREAIATAVLEHRYEAPVRALLLRAKEIGEELYNETYSPEIQAQMAAMPKGFLSQQNYLCVKLLGRNHNVYFGMNWGGELYGFSHVPHTERKVNDRLIADRHHSRSWNSVDMSADLRRKLEFLNNDIKDHNEQYAKTNKQVQAALASVSTIKKLIEVWPEIEPFASPYLEDAPVKVNLPAIPVASLNAILDLPVNATA